ncbi:HNH endonuclease signature motif containing protein [Rhizobium sp. 18065]|uniref:HNH endonuclease n=1 Tax=Rhizobium sp. 18065 TaxID=2681411 RepID=UPI001358E382|nr:HNH endonuclease signature motif containing protein [Rhizobium sp. 18065]
MARKNRDEFNEADAASEPVFCPLCERVIPDDEIDAHHLIPKSKGGKKTVGLHRVCHDQIHAIFTDSQLAKNFSTIEALLEDPTVQKFVAWIKSKPPGFSDSAKETRSGRGRK